MQINKCITPYNRWIGRDGNKIEWIVLHYTANVGDTARGNAEYFASRYFGSSAHFFVDEDEVWQSVELDDTAWHCGDNPPSKNGCTNRTSIGIEMCTSWKDGEYYIEPKVADRTVALVLELLKTYPNAKLCRHYDVTGKRCPMPWVDHPEEWEKFKERTDVTPMTQSERQEFDALKARVATLAAKVASGEEYDRTVTREVAGLRERVGTTWDKTDEMPEWMRPTVEKLVGLGYLKGDEKGDLALTTDLARALVVLDRAGGFAV